MVYNSVILWYTYRNAKTFANSHGKTRKEHTTMKKRRILSALLALITAAGTAIGAAGAVSAADESPYKDVKKSWWSYPYVMYATEHGYMNGMGGGKFEPQGSMTRAMVVTVLYRFQGEPEVKIKSGFKDVKADAWYADAVYWAAENKIVNGVEPGKFAPEDSITRQQLAAILMRYAPFEFIKTEDRKDITGYSDYKKVQAYARDAMSWTNAVGLITGVTKKTLEPGSSATREQFATILQRFKEDANFEYELVYNDPNYTYEPNKTVELVTDADIYVAVDGNDSNPGTLDKPIATFARAKEMVRELKKTATDEIVVAFKAGNYGSLDNLTFTAEDGGSESVPIRYTAYGDGEVLFANGTIIKADEFVKITDAEKSMFPEKAVDNIYKVDLTGRVDELLDTNAIFSESGICHEARYPNKDANGTDTCFKDFTTRYEDPSKTEFEYDTIILSTLVARTVDNFSTVEGLKVTGFLRVGWLIDTFKVKSYNKDNKHLTFDFSNRYCANGYSLDTYCLGYEGRFPDTVFFHNLAELLDKEGEYWYDTKTHQLYVYAPNGDYTITSKGKFITVEQSAEHLSFVGLSFNGSTDTVFTSAANHTTIDKCTFKNIGAQTVVIRVNGNNFTLSNCELANFVNGGIYLGGRVSYNLITHGNNVIENNYFHDFGQPQYFSDACAIGVDDVATSIKNNVLKNGAHGGIRFSGIDIVMEYNVFDNMMMTTQDFGAVYTWNSSGLRDNKIRYNLFTNMMENARYGIYLDDNTMGQEVYGNIFYKVKGAAVVLHGGRENNVHDNIFIGNGMVSYTGSTIYNYEIDPDPNAIFSSGFYGYFNSQRAAEGTPGYELWKQRWPEMYNYHYDASKVGEFECIYTTVHRIHNNVGIGFKGVDITKPLSFGETGDKYGDIKNNVLYSEDENPFFVDPTHGDYTLRDDADFIAIDFKNIGVK